MTARHREPDVSVKMSLRRAASENLEYFADQPIGTQPGEAASDAAADEAPRGEIRKDDPRQHPRSPALWAAMGALAGAEVAWALPHAFGIGG